MSATVGPAFSSAWAIFKAHAGYFIGLYILVSIIVGIPYVITLSLSANDMSGAASVVNFITLLVSVVIGLGTTTIALAALDNKPLSIGMLFSNMNRYVSYLGATILVGIVVGLGTILFILPGIFLGIRLMFWPFFVVDKQLGAIDAIKASWRMTSGIFFDVFVFMLACLGLAILGAIPLGLGWLVVMPVVGLATAQFYRNAMRAPAPVAAAVPVAAQM